MEALAFGYGMLVMFVLSGTARNRARGRRNPRVLDYAGYLLLGFSAALSAALFAWAILTAAA